MKTNALIEQAQLLIDNESYDRALELLKTAREKDKSNPEIIEKLALLSKTLDDTHEAANYFEELLVLSPDSIVAHSELMDIYLHNSKYKYYLTRAKYKVIQGNVGQSVPDYKKAIENTTDEKDIINARLLLAKAYEFTKKTSNAIDEYYRILDYDDNLSVYYKLADLYSETGDKQSSINILERAMEAYPAEETIKEMLSGLYVETNDLENALKYVKSDLTRVKIYLMQGRNDLAFEILGKIEDKKSSQYHALMAEYHFNNKDFDRCVECIKEFKIKNPDNPLVYQMMALVCEEKNETYKAHYYWGKYYLVKDDSHMALNEFLIGHQIDSNNESIIKEIIKIYENSGETNNVIEFYEKLLVIEPENVEVLKNLGKFYQQMYEFKNALKYYEKVLEVNNKDYETYYNIGFCYEKLKNNVIAKEYYNKYLDKSPLTQEAQLLKARMSNISDESAEESDEGLLEKILKIFSG